MMPTTKVNASEKAKSRQLSKQTRRLTLIVSIIPCVDTNTKYVSHHNVYKAFILGP